MITVNAGWESTTQIKATSLSPIVTAKAPANGFKFDPSIDADIYDIDANVLKLALSLQRQYHDRELIGWAQVDSESKMTWLSIIAAGSSASVNNSAIDAAWASSKCLEETGSPANCQFHTHNSMSAFFSDTDEKEYFGYVDAIIDVVGTGEYWAVVVGSNFWDWKTRRYIWKDKKVSYNNGVLRIGNARFAPVEKPTYTSRSSYVKSDDGYSDWWARVESATAAPGAPPHTTDRSATANVNYQVPAVQSTSVSENEPTVYPALYTRILELMSMPKEEAILLLSDIASFSAFEQREILLCMNVEALELVKRGFISSVEYDDFVELCTKINQLSEHEDVDAIIRLIDSECVVMIDHLLAALSAAKGTADDVLSVKATEILEGFFTGQAEATFDFPSMAAMLLRCVDQKDEEELLLNLGMVNSFMENNLFWSYIDDSGMSISFLYDYGLYTRQKHNIFGASANLLMKGVEPEKSASIGIRGWAVDCYLRNTGLEMLAIHPAAEDACVATEDARWLAMVLSEAKSVRLLSVALGKLDNWTVSNIKHLMRLTKLLLEEMDYPADTKQKVLTMLTVEVSGVPLLGLMHEKIIHPIGAGEFMRYYCSTAIYERFVKSVGMQ